MRGFRTFGFAAVAVILTGVAFAYQGPALFEDGMTHGRVVRVIDGDTIDVRRRDGSEQRIRLFAVAAPERYERGGKESQVALYELAGGRTVTCNLVDRSYGREVGVCLAGNIDLNAEMIRSGHACWDFTFDAAKIYRPASQVAVSRPASCGRGKALTQALLEGRRE